LGSSAINPGIIFVSASLSRSTGKNMKKAKKLEKTQIAAEVVQELSRHKMVAAFLNPMLEPCMFRGIFWLTMCQLEIK
jgi:hypothetical protein